MKNMICSACAVTLMLFTIFEVDSSQETDPERLRLTQFGAEHTEKLALLMEKDHTLLASYAAKKPMILACLAVKSPKIASEIAKDPEIASIVGLKLAKGFKKEKIEEIQHTQPEAYRTLVSIMALAAPAPAANSVPQTAAQAPAANSVPQSVEQQAKQTQPLLLFPSSAQQLLHQSAPNSHDPQDNFKKEVLRNPSPKNILRLIEIINETGVSQSFLDSRLRVMGILADDGIKEARDYLSAQGYWIKPNDMCKNIREYYEDKEIIEEQNRRLDENLNAYLRSFEECSPYEINTRYHTDIDRSGLTITNGKQSYHVPFPIAKEFLGLYGHFSCGGGDEWYYHFNFGEVVERGWKMHISAKPSNALKIAQIVIPICKREGVYCKVLPIPAMREAYTGARFRAPGGGAPAFSQRGKFIAIYPKNDEQANKIAEAIHKEFLIEGLSREDFVSVYGDFQVGRTGGIYARLALYKKDDGLRESPNISMDLLEKHAKEEKCPDFKQYKHPFGRLGLSFNAGSTAFALPKEASEIAQMAKDIYNFELIMNDSPVEPAIDSSSSSSSSLSSSS